MPQNLVTLWKQITLWKIDWSFLTSVTSEFAKKYAISVRQAFNYIRRFNGVKFLQEFYGIEHTQSYNDIVEDVKNICINNGGLIGK